MPFLRPAPGPPAPLSLSPWQNQPYLTLFVLYKLTTLALLHPYWVLKRLFHLGDAFPRSWTLNEVLNVQRFRHIERLLSACDVAPGTEDYRVLGRRSEESRPVWVEEAEGEYVQGILRSVEKVKPVRVPAYLAEKGKDDAAGASISIAEGEGVLLYLHGGGFMFGNATSSDVTYANPRALLSLVPSLKHVLVPSYRKITQAPFPAALLDSLSAYLHLLLTLRIPPSQIILSGDSAGASLALALTRYIRDELKKPEWLPNALVLFSPLASQETDLGMKRMLVPPRNLKRCLLDFDVIQPYMALRLLHTSPISLIDSPWLSPASSVVPATKELFEGFPPCFVSAGGAEVLLEGIEELVRRLAVSEVECVYHFQPDAPHDWQMFPWFNPAQGALCYEKAAAFVEEKLGGKQLS